MKNNKLIIIIVLTLLLTGCSQADIDKDISSIEWTVESVSTLEGQPLKDKLEACDVELKFIDKDRFSLIDNIDSKEYKGTYRMEKVDSSYKLDLVSENEEIRGTYGIRKYDDNRETLTIILETKDRIYTFIEKN